MVTNQKSKEDQEDLNQRLRSLKIDRGTYSVTRLSSSRSPKLLLLVML